MRRSSHPRGCSPCPALPLLTVGGQRPREGVGVGERGQGGGSAFLSFRLRQEERGSPVAPTRAWAPSRAEVGALIFTERKGTLPGPVTLALGD